MTTNPESILKEIEEAYAGIPFGNSDFQNRAFVLAAQITPARAYRQIGLRMFDRIQSIKELRYNRAKEDIDIDEKWALIASPDASIYDKRRAELDIQQILDRRNYQDKLLADAITELECLYAEFRRLPRYTREQFEAEERDHFELRLRRQCQIGEGPQASLADMEFLTHWPELVEETRKQLEAPE